MADLLAWEEEAPEDVSPDSADETHGLHLRMLEALLFAVREPIPILMLSNTHRSGLLAAFKTLARAVAERDGAVIGVESTLGEGSVFWVDYPAG